MRRSHMLSGTMVLITALSLAGCASGPSTSGSGLPRSGAYKVGKPYQINGVWYYPAEDYSYNETGIASWYGPGFHERVTANGEIYNQNELTAAHKTLPMPSIVRVTNLDNGRSIVVRINDRGPYVNGRIIDMSRRGAQLLGYENTGTAKVRVQILADESRAVAAAARQGTPPTMLAETEGPPPKAAPRAPVQVAGAESWSKPAPASSGVTSTPIPPPTTIPGSVEDGRFIPAPIVSERPVKPQERIYVQVGAFGNQDNVNRVRARLSAIGQRAQVTATTSGRLTLHRVRVGPLDTVDTADAVLNQIIQAGLTDAKIVVD